MREIHSNIQRQMLLSLARSGGKLFLYTFHRKYRFSPAQISNAARMLEKKNLISSDELIIQLTAEGKKYTQSKELLTQFQDIKPWRNCPMKYTQPKLGIFTPYLPKITLLDKEFKFNNNTNEV